MADLDGAAPVIPPTALASPPPVGQQTPSTLSISNTTATLQPPRKRKRALTEDDLADGSAKICSSHQANDRIGKMDKTETNVVPVHDEKYYDDGADCVIRVEDTLFRVSVTSPSHMICGLFESTVGHSLLTLNGA